MLFMILKTFFDKNKWNLSNEIHIAYKKRYALKIVKSLRGVNSDFGHSFQNGGVTKWPTEFWGQVYGSFQIRPMFKLLGQWQNGPQFFPRIPTDHTRVINPMNFSVTSLAKLRQSSRESGKAWRIRIKAWFSAEINSSFRLSVIAFTWTQ